MNPQPPPETKNPQLEQNALQIICVHHFNTPIGISQQLQQLTTISHQLNILSLLIQSTNITLNHIIKNKNQKWNQIPSPNFTSIIDTPPPLPSYGKTRTPKFPFKYYYYIDGSFTTSKQIYEDTWIQKRAAYGIYNEYGSIYNPGP